LGQEPERFGVAGTGQQTGARGQGAIGRDPRARAYEQARRHSARVRFYKRVIPLGTAVAVAALVAFALAAPSGPGGLSLGPISFSGTKVTMESPKMTGFHKDKRPYEVTATSATQDVRKPNVIELNQMRGRLVVDDNGTTARLEAATGVFDTTREYLELRQDVRVTTDAGHAARLKSAAIDFKAGTVRSREAVAITLTNGTIDAQGLEVADNGRVLTFLGRVHAVFEADADAGGAPDKVAESPLVQPARALAPVGQPMSMRP
jgi:lipopolysaccharide export system protein LptC